MKIHDPIERRIVATLRFVFILCPVIIAPTILYDPISLPRFLILISLVTYLLALVFRSNQRIHILDLKFIIFPFALSLVLISLIHINEVNTLYGVFGRNNGFLTYMALIIIFGSSYLVSRYAKTFFVQSLQIVSVINMIYGLLQYFYLDPIPWNLKDGRLIGTFGQPNFFSAILGLGAILFFANLLSVPKLFQKILNFFLVLVMNTLCLLSDSVQGIYMFSIGAIILIYFYLKNRFGSFYSLSFLVSVVILSFFVIFGFLQSGPLSKFLYQPSITFRGYYWKAGIRMGFDNPISGIGLDNYAYWFQSSVNRTYVDEVGIKSNSDSAHNIFIDLFASGGVILLVTYISFCLAITLIAFKNIRKNSSEKLNFLFFALWIAFLAQSIISINNIGIAIWGWSCAGIIFGISKSKVEKKGINKSNLFLELDVKTSLISGVFFLVGFLIALPPVVKDYSFYNAFKMRNDDLLVKSITMYPRNSHYDVLAGTILMGNGKLAEALGVAQRSISYNSRNFPSWLQIWENPLISVEDKKIVLTKLKELDPFFDLNYLKK